MTQAMPSENLKPRTSEINGRLWGAHARDWAAIQEPQFIPLYSAVFDRTGVTKGTRHLDVGCGAGLAAQMATERGARVSAIDAADGLLAIARERLPGGDVRQGDLEELPYADGEFDLVTGFNSFQYAGNPTVALREGKRVAKPDGRVVIVTWGDPEGMEAVAVITSLKAVMPPPPPGTPGPFALSDQTALRQFAKDAGLTPLEIFDVDSPFTFPDEDTALRGWSASGVAARAAEHAGEQAVRETQAKAIKPFRRADGSYRIGASFRCLLARP
jgi:SAM-dependent methyltransferase